MSNDKKTTEVTEKAVDFLQKVMNDDDLLDRLKDKPLSDAVAVAAQMGYDVSEDELMAAEASLHEEKKADVVELDVEDMDKVAGGGMWNGDEAPDGHEMGCNLFFHRWDYSKETGNWCELTYYSKGCSSGACVEHSHL